MELWTNGEWKSTPHRVIYKGSRFRVSVPIFFEPDFTAQVEPLPTCVARTGGTIKYGSVKYADHLIRKIKSNFY
jgi:isopenicillin N synthase-like dioxygenase